MDRYGQEARRDAGRPPGPGAPSTCRGSRQAVRDRYGKHLWCQQALLARRLVEAGVAFVTIDLSYHPASGTWDNHGDNIPPYGGISKGLKPLLPLFDHLITTLVADLEERGPARRRAGDRHGRVRPDADDGHAGQHRRPEPLAGRHVDGAGRRRPAARPGHRRDRAGRRLHQGPARHARRPGGDDLPPHGRARSTPPTSTRPAGPAPSSSTAARSPSCSDRRRRRSIPRPYRPRRTEKRQHRGPAGEYPPVHWKEVGPCVMHSP